MAKIANRTSTGKIGKWKENQYFNVTHHGVDPTCKKIYGHMDHIVSMTFEVGDKIIELDIGDIQDIANRIDYFRGQS